MATPARTLQGKLAIVTGGTRGIGLAICANLAAKGCNLVTNHSTSTSATTVQALVSELAAKHNVRAYAVQVDLADASAPRKLVDAATTHFPGAGIDIIVNNAGVTGFSLAQDQTVEDFHRQYAINVLAPLLLLQAALPHLPHGTDEDPTPGRVVNISSVASAIGAPGQCVYSGTKAALEAMTRSWARELAGRATVNALNPGPVATDMYAAVCESPAFVNFARPWFEHTAGAQTGVGARESVAKGLGGRAGTVEEVAGLVAMLVSAESAWCTGSVVCANGGMWPTR